MLNYQLRKLLNRLTLENDGPPPLRFKIWKQKCQSYVALFYPSFIK